MAKREENRGAWLAVGIVGTVCCVAGRGFVIVDLWRLFATPLGVPAVTFWHVIGLLTLATIVRPGFGRKETEAAKSDTPMQDAAIHALVIGLLVTPLVWAWARLAAHFAGLS